MNTKPIKPSMLCWVSYQHPARTLRGAFVVTVRPAQDIERLRGPLTDQLVRRITGRDHWMCDPAVAGSTLTIQTYNPVTGIHPCELYQAPIQAKYLNPIDADPTTADSTTKEKELVS